MQLNPTRSGMPEKLRRELCVGDTGQRQAEIHKTSNTAVFLYKHPDATQYVLYLLNKCGQP